jgi:membrane-anchored protein YejM (alkaline phosphatase superfamily)
MAAQTKKSWTELSPKQRVLTVVGAVVQLTLLALAQWDIRRRPVEQIRGNKRFWRAVSLVNFVGPIAYFLLGRKTEVGSA